jgi:hypothetical protein
MIMNIAQIASQAGGTAPAYGDIPVVVVTASGKVRQVVSAHYDGHSLVLTTGK